MSVDERFIRRVTSLRKAKGITQEELAKRVPGLGRVQLSKLEGGQLRVRLSHAVHIAEVLDVPLSALVDEEPMVMTWTWSLDDNRYLRTGLGAEIVPPHGKAGRVGQLGRSSNHSDR